MVETGVLVIDKPAGITSFAVVDQVRRVRHARKAGHAGTLDPAATGVLLVCLGDATKITRFLMEGEKVYRACAQFGVETDTLDGDGRVVASCDATRITTGDVEQALTQFVGHILQTPPMYSALKVQGRRLYELARQGLEVERKARAVEVREAALENFDDATIRATIRVTCSKGTYIRTLVADLGQALGVGAHVASLRRLRVGGFSEADAVTLQEAATAPLVPMDRALGSQLFRNREETET